MQHCVQMLVLRSNANGHALCWVHCCQHTVCQDIAGSSVATLSPQTFWTSRQAMKDSASGTSPAVEKSAHQGFLVCRSSKHACSQGGVTIIELINPFHTILSILLQKQVQGQTAPALQSCPSNAHISRIQPLHSILQWPHHAGKRS